VNSLVSKVVGDFEDPSIVAGLPVPAESGSAEDTDIVVVDPAADCLAADSDSDQHMDRDFAHPMPAADMETDLETSYPAMDTKSQTK
jgi:hypothetical protein